MTAPDRKSNDPPTAPESFGTVAELLFYLSDPDSRRLLEEFRIRYEAERGPTDMTKRYTSLWPSEQQMTLFELDPKAYFDGLPLFAQAYLKQEILRHAKLGALDDLPQNCIRLALRGCLVSAPKPEP